MHDLVVGNDWVSAFEFWKLTPGQVWWLVSSKMPKEAMDAGASRARVRDMIKAAKAKEAQQNG